MPQSEFWVNKMNKEEIKEEMWNKFNLAENNQDQGAGILYCLKYDEGRIKSHQESIVNALKLMGINS